MLSLKDYKYKRDNSPSSESSAFYFRGSVHLKVVIFSLLILTSMVFTQLVFANSLATDGEKLSQVQEEIRNLEKENMSIKVEIAQESSLTKLVKKAKDSGFIKPQSVTVADKF